MWIINFSFLLTWVGLQLTTMIYMKTGSKFPVGENQRFDPISAHSDSKLYIYMTVYNWLYQVKVQKMLLLRLFLPHFQFLSMVFGRWYSVRLLPLSWNEMKEKRSKSQSINKWRSWSVLFPIAYLWITSLGCDFSMLFSDYHVSNYSLIWIT